MDSLRTLSFIECIKNGNIYNEFLNLPEYTQNVLSKNCISTSNIKDILQKYNLCERYINGMDDSKLGFLEDGFPFKIDDHPRTATLNYIRNLHKLEFLLNIYWYNICYYLILPVPFYEEFRWKVHWDTLFRYGKIPKNKVVYLLKKYRKVIKQSFIEKIHEILEERRAFPFQIPNVIKKMMYFVSTGIITYDDYDFLDHIEDTSKIFIFEQLSGITYYNHDLLGHIEDTSEIFIFKQLSQP